jgi:hypothetical protein
MPIWNVEVIQPVSYDQMTPAECRRYEGKVRRMEEAGYHSDWHRQNGNLDRSYLWADKMSDRRVDLVKYCNEIDAKYA